MSDATKVALKLLELAAMLAPSLVPLFRSAAHASPDHALRDQVLAVLPEESESERALRGL